MLCFFVSDLHGRLDRYEKLLRTVRNERPRAVLLGGDLLPGGTVHRSGPHHDFICEYLAVELAKLREGLGDDYPRVFVILGNDDPQCEEAAVVRVASDGLWEYVHNCRTMLADFAVYGYTCIPPTPFRLKDWERYDVSRHLEPGAIPPEEGIHTVPFEVHELVHATIREDLDRLFGEDDLTRAIGLIHAPPYQTALDRAALDGRTIDHVPLDVHVGSVALRRFIERRQPHVTLHGHIHESARLTGRWRDRIGRTHLLSAAHDGPELALVRFDPRDPSGASRELL